jgi:hypothetical protein
MSTRRVPHRAPPEGAFEVLVVGEATQDDVDRALLVQRIRVGDGGERPV